MPQRFIADDFPAIRARLKELKREESQPVNSSGRTVRQPLMVDRPETSPAIRRFLLKYGREKGLY